jgi:hypothetical protein
VVEQERILAEARRRPDREQDGTATWSLSTLQQALRVFFKLNQQQMREKY